MAECKIKSLRGAIIYRAFLIALTTESLLLTGFMIFLHTSIFRGPLLSILFWMLFMSQMLGMKMMEGLSLFDLQIPRIAQSFLFYLGIFIVQLTFYFPLFLVLIFSCERLSVLGKKARRSGN